MHHPNEIYVVWNDALVRHQSFVHWKSNASLNVNAAKAIVDQI